jgi:hypothetical protein
VSNRLSDSRDNATPASLTADWMRSSDSSIDPDSSTLSSIVTIFFSTEHSLIMTFLRKYLRPGKTPKIQIFTLLNGHTPQRTANSAALPLAKPGRRDTARVFVRIHSYGRGSMPGHLVGTSGRTALLGRTEVLEA